MNFLVRKLNIKEETVLRTHTYKTIDKSILSKYIFKNYCIFMLKHTPTSIAPNTLTMMGYCVMLINTVVVILNDPLLKNGSPFLSLVSAICLAVYFTTDNIDGAQARRLKEMSPLGQMFDHGVDSCCVFFCMLSLISSLGLGLCYTSLALMSCVMSGFYLSGLEENFTGIFEFGYISGPTEGLVFVFFLHLVSCFYNVYLRKIFTSITLSPFLIDKLNIPHISPLFIFILGIIGYNSITSYCKCIKLGDLNKKKVVAKSFLRVFILFLPLFVLHNNFRSSLNLQYANILIFSLCFSLNYIEEVFSNIASISIRKFNWIYKVYICVVLFGYLYDLVPYSLCFHVFGFIATLHYLYNVFHLVIMCREALNINIFYLNKKIVT